MFQILENTLSVWCKLDPDASCTQDIVNVRPARQRRRRSASSPRRPTAHPSTVHDAGDSGGRSEDQSAAEDRRLWVKATRSRHQTYLHKKVQYWLARLTRCGRSSSQLWRSLSTLLGRNRDVWPVLQVTLPTTLHNIDDIRAATAVAREASSLRSFRPCTTSEVRRIIIIMTSPVKSCSLDAAPRSLVCEFVDVLLPYLTGMVNAVDYRFHRNTPS